MYETTADLMEDAYYARVEADMEQAEWEQAGRERARDIAEGNCPHDGGFGFRWEAFYPEQVGLFVGEIFCHECQAPKPDAFGPQCHVCDLDHYNCMGERGVGGSGKFAHDAFVMPPLVMVGYAPAGGF